MSKIKFLFVAIILSVWQGHSQCIVSADSDYEVVVYLNAYDVSAPSSCDYGYNYNIYINYDIEIIGPDAPSSMYTLQARLHCGSQNLFFQLPNNGGSGSLLTTANPWRNANDCATVTPQDLNCNSFTLEIHGNNIPDQDINCSPSALPVSLIYFTGELNNLNQTELKWQTASESNSKEFVVERMTEELIWTEIGKKNAAGNSNSIIDYSYTDKTITEGVFYYRIKQIDNDGTYEYSNIIAIDNTFKTNGILSIYPNPSNDIINVSNSFNSKHTISIFNILGENVTHLVTTKTFDNNHSQIDISALPKGSYIVSCNAINKSFIKN